MGTKTKKGIKMEGIEITTKYKNDGLLELRIKHYIKKGMETGAIIAKMKPYKLGVHYTIKGVK